ncbi:peptide deformylase [Brevibacillus sp. SYP-B805]|uniref:peptide deformylase n=1 Tax=Brevibacillus sp. SYP-B805 TaxID=1578199 RepID=UPI0013EBD4D8|nr:peptide deformylase [Brevibacillus sp. SYP-B805]NGQ96736.1 peptide deformylase [Brevibacillus sp. SYP-B805]
MAERSIRKLGDPVLREVCKPVPAVTANVIKLLDDLAETLYAAPGRAGLAAPQVGIPKRVAVLDMGDGLIELINPQIVRQKGVQTGPEACLSLPGIVGYVKRARAVTVKTWNREGKEVLIEGEGPLARCLQHEIDHLDGILFIDRVKQGELWSERSREPLDVLELIRLSRRYVKR